MSELPNEKEILARVKTALDQGCDRLDADTQSRLGQARRRALSRVPAGPGFLDHWMPVPVAGWAAAAAAVLLTAWALWAPLNEPGGKPLENLDLLASADQWDLYEEYEFYAWLVVEEDYETG